MNENSNSGVGCARCALEPAEIMPLNMAFQPIVRLSSRSVIAHEALVRGMNGESAKQILSEIDDSTMYQFDQNCRVLAIRSAVERKIPALLSINFMANAVYNPATCIMRTLDEAQKQGFPISRIVFEVSEQEQMRSNTHIRRILNHYREEGFKIAIDDFGAGHSGLSLLADFVPDYIKLDISLVRGIEHSYPRQRIASGLVQLANDLGTEIIAEGIETETERNALIDAGIDLMQGYYFARPSLDEVPEIPPERLASAS